MRAQQAREADGPHHPERGIDHEDFGEGLRQVLCLAHVVDEAADGPERGRGHELRLHETAGRLFGIFEVAFKGRAVARAELGKDFLLVLRLEVFEQVGRVVRVQLGDGARQQFVGQRFRKLVANRVVKFRQHLEVERGPNA